MKDRTHSFELRWVNSHPVEYWQLHPDIPDHVYIHNVVADALAGEGTERHEIDIGLAAELKDRIEQAKAVIRRNIEVSRHLVGIVADPRREIKPAKAATYVKRLRSAMASTPHVARICRKRIWCAQCLGFSPRSGSKIPWLILPCTQGASADTWAGAPRQSHNCLTATDGGIV